MNSYLTEQEDFWAGTFGDDYIKRNNAQALIASNTALFAKVLSKTQNIRSVIEFGANIGLNIHALKTLLPSGNFNAVEINAKAVEELKTISGLNIYHSSILNYLPDISSDLALIKGVLIHINPDMLPKVYQTLYAASDRYICIVEYYNPAPIEVNYRGHSGKLFKRDFAGEMMDLFSDLELIDYGFVYHRDPNFPADDLTWFLLEKKG